ncbi:MAG: hypothetical protein COV59_03855 [Candidatus Magasanikbacteria bacterium CG11_big_fil_rev_8_21_14_0_20_39_34]|uniref:DUF2779 domain-containing protein n=1 Tax=Candidatus Magasanikbacteria bacterium CG11_big_fil_rev_8_21_14_0_20_39_34 TaxID=1974653 RepID=A0A2H0N4G0_9BACT|nr:MAG: hypothetical protein COV59_03855 [Candidatus Magasanikbacteria bacterium CG11_big_fil_rev_8_21_14_0_20_39_34]
MYITKTDYLEYLFCKKNFWLKKHKPELFEDIELSEFEKKIVEEGNIADETARHLFPEGVLVTTHEQEALEDTNQYIDTHEKVIFQGAFFVDSFLIRADVIVWDEILGGWELYEVKATTKVKREQLHSHIKDIAFQKEVLTRSGLSVVKSCIIHLNGEYKRRKDISWRDVFVIEDVTDEVKEVVDEVSMEMDEMKKAMNMPEGSGCACIYRGRSNQCTTFAYSNPKVPEYSIHDLHRIGLSKKKLEAWVDEGVFALEDIPNTSILNDKQALQVQTYLSGEPFIDRDKIRKEIESLEYPLYFFDYEGYGTAIPEFQGYGTFEQVPFQYSLHIMHENGEIEHREHLVRQKRSDIAGSLVKQLAEDIGPKGSIISWHKSYEVGRNNTLARIYPSHTHFFEDMNDRMFDLESIFLNQLYVHPDFKGKTSIKKILPVLVPELTYDKLSVKAGDQAMERWEYMLSEECEDEEAIYHDLLEYCKQDTWAMVKIYEELLALL